MTIGKEYRFSHCQALTPLGKPITIPEGVYVIAETDVVSIAIRGQIVDITPAAFELLKIDGKARSLRRSCR